jgi:hypothetical protein
MDRESPPAAGAALEAATPLWLHAMLGVEAGIRGGLFLCLLYAASALWSGRPWWVHLNLLGATFAGDRAFRSGAGWDTLTGAALALALAGAVGGAFGLSVRRMAGRATLAMAGLVTAAVCHAVSMWWIWPNVNVWMADRLPPAAAALGQVLLGLSLGRIGRPAGKLQSFEKTGSFNRAGTRESGAAAEGAEDPQVRLE